jgi:hypothetical protein
LSQAILDFFYLRNKQGVAGFHQLVEQGMPCEHRCQFFMAYSSPIFEQKQSGILHAEKAYLDEPYQPTYVWERAWSQFMAGDFDQTLIRIEEAEKFVGYTSFLFRAMLSQANNHPLEATLHWLDYFHSIDKLKNQDLERLKKQAKEVGYQESSTRLLKVLINIPIDQRIALLLLVGDKTTAIKSILETDSLQAQTYLIAMHVSPIFTLSFNQKELEMLEKHIWKRLD